MENLQDSTEFSLGSMFGIGGFLQWRGSELGMILQAVGPLQVPVKLELILLLRELVWSRWDGWVENRVFFLQNKLNIASYFAQSKFRSQPPKNSWP